MTEPMTLAEFQQLDAEDFEHIASLGHYDRIYNALAEREKLLERIEKSPLCTVRLGSSRLGVWISNQSHGSIRIPLSIAEWNEIADSLPIPNDGAHGRLVWFPAEEKKA